MQAESSPARRAWLLAIILLHAAAFLGWRGVRHERESSPRREAELVYLQAPKPQPVTRPAAAAPATAPKRPAPPPPVATTAAAPAAAETAPPVAAAVPVPATGAQPDPFAQPDKTPPLRERLRLSAAGVDRQLRKESLNKFATIILPDTKLGMAIAKAQDKEWVLEQTSDVGDGVVMKRYRKGNQEYCEYTNLVGARGQDPGRDFGKTKVMTCP